ncbi:DUF2268 domain-containing protein [Lentibacillus halophilus]|uniref:DUF2268 domain-containing protein n=1 Tax=Lentibacillus halophilus TaxID=295065 RepID=A0ABN0Z8G1_9BACI
MTVIRTDKWLLDFCENPIDLCQKLKAQFDEDVRSSDIHQHLSNHGMYRQAPMSGEEWIGRLQEKNIWQTVRREERQLRTLWQGPDIPVFIFPSDPFNQTLWKDQNGKSGLAFPDKLFLFVSEKNSENEIRALFTHEYHHVCRLNSYRKHMQDYELLDTIILEGAAESAVRERLGEQYTADWTAYYSNETVERLWKHYVYPNRTAHIVSPIHQQILYGHGFLPKMTGYCTGYYLVNHYMEATNATSSDLLTTEPTTIIEKMDGA